MWCMSQGNGAIGKLLAVWTLNVSCSSSPFGNFFHWSSRASSTVSFPFLKNRQSRGGFIHSAHCSVLLVEIKREAKNVDIAKNTRPEMTLKLRFRSLIFSPFCSHKRWIKAWRVFLYYSSLFEIIWYLYISLRSSIYIYIYHIPSLVC